MKPNLIALLLLGAAVSVIVYAVDEKPVTLGYTQPACSVDKGVLTLYGKSSWEDCANAAIQIAAQIQKERDVCLHSAKAPEVPKKK